MSIPLPPADASGGFFVILVSSATQTHRQRFHVAPFTADNANCAYSPSLTGGDASVVATFTAVATGLAGMTTSDRTMSLDSIWQVVGSGVVQCSFIAPAAVAGTLALSALSPEVFMCFNFKSTRGGRAKFFMMGPNTADAPQNPPEVLTATSGASAKKTILTTLSASTSGVRAHDGSPLQAWMRITHGINRKTRRRIGFA